MASRFFIRVFVLLFLFVFVVKGGELTDPLRGVAVDHLLEDQGDVFLVKIDNARRGADACRYEYTASVLHEYRGVDRVGEVVSFATHSPLRVDDYLLIIRNANSVDLNPGSQTRCRMETIDRLGSDAFMLRQDEIVPVYELNDEYFAFLPYRMFSSDLPGVYDRKINLPEDPVYTMLRSAGGIADGKFVRLDNLLGQVGRERLEQNP